jgi:hypothetical protein
MSDVSDYANLQLALALLGESFVNRYPDSGAMQTVNSAKDVAQTTLQQEEIKKQQKEAEKKAKKQGIGGLLGAAVPTALAPLTGGASLAFSGLGAQAGSALAGGPIDPGAIASSIPASGFGGQQVATQQPAASGVVDPSAMQSTGVLNPDYQQMASTQFNPLAPPAPQMPPWGYSVPPVPLGGTQPTYNYQTGQFTGGY